jgi:hypothetical protein
MMREKAQEMRRGLNEFLGRELDEPADLWICDCGNVQVFLCDLVSGTNNRPAPTCVECGGAMTRDVCH